MLVQYIVLFYKVEFFFMKPSICLLELLKFNF